MLLSKAHTLLLDSELCGLITYSIMSDTSKTCKIVLIHITFRTNKINKRTV